MSLSHAKVRIILMLSKFTLFLKAMEPRSFLLQKNCAH